MDYDDGVADLLLMIIYSMYYLYLLLGICFVLLYFKLFRKKIKQMKMTNHKQMGC